MIYGVDYETRTISGLPVAPAEPDPLLCGACGKPVDSLSRCAWDETLMVGECCEVHTDHRCPACRSDNLEYGDAAVRCLDCGCLTTEAAAEVQVGPYALTSPTRMPRLDPIRIRPVTAASTKVHRTGAA